MSLKFPLLDRGVWNYPEYKQEVIRMIDGMPYSGPNLFLPKGRYWWTWWFSGELMVSLWWFYDDLSDSMMIEWWFIGGFDGDSMMILWWFEWFHVDLLSKNRILNGDLKDIYSDLRWCKNVSDTWKIRTPSWRVNGNKVLNMGSWKILGFHGQSQPGGGFQADCDHPQWMASARPPKWSTATVWNCWGLEMGLLLDDREQSIEFRVLTYPTHRFFIRRPFSMRRMCHHFSPVFLASRLLVLLAFFGDQHHQSPTISYCQIQKCLVSMDWWDKNTAPIPPIAGWFMFGKIPSRKLGWWLGVPLWLRKQPYTIL